MVDDSQLQAPLAPFMGEVPAAPAWFAQALAHAPERSFVKVEGARVETLVWGEAGRPGLLFLHGYGAHADWYSFIAPFFAARYRVATMSWSGMGGSDWRESYSVEQFGREALAVAETTGLFEAPTLPVVAGHSFGGRITIGLAADHGEKFAAAIIVDPPVFAPKNQKAKPLPRNAQPAHHVYPTLAAGLARFRLLPAQPCDNPFILDHIARLSLREIPGDRVPEAATETAGWSWRFDPALWTRLNRRDPMPLLRVARCPLALVRGSRSLVMQREDAAYMMAALPAGAPCVEVPEAGHHIMLDQPLAFVAAIEALLATRPATWPMTSPANWPAPQEAAST
jgi:pimeloyl-ACP methyl ester carboxylesterase